MKVLHYSKKKMLKERYNVNLKSQKEHITKSCKEMLLELKKLNKHMPVKNESQLHQ